MIYTRAQITKMGSLVTLFDMTIRNTGDSSDAGTDASKIGNYDVILREQDRLTITKSQQLRIEGFPRKKYAAADLLFLALYGMLGPDHCNKLLKEMKDGVGDSKTKRTKRPEAPTARHPRSGKAPKAIQAIKPPKPKTAKTKILYGRGQHPK